MEGCAPSSFAEGDQNKEVKNNLQKQRDEFKLTLSFLKLLQQTGQIRCFNSYRRREQLIRMFVLDRNPVESNIWSLSLLAQTNTDLQASNHTF